MLMIVIPVSMPDPCSGARSCTYTGWKASTVPQLDQSMFVMVKLLAPIEEDIAMVRAVNVGDEQVIDAVLCTCVPG